MSPSLQLNTLLDACKQVYLLPINQGFYRLIAGNRMGVAECKIHVHVGQLRKEANSKQNSYNDINWDAFNHTSHALSCNYYIHSLDVRKCMEWFVSSSLFTIPLFNFCPEPHPYVHAVLFGLSDYMYHVWAIYDKIHVLRYGYGILLRRLQFMCMHISISCIFFTIIVVTYVLQFS